MGRPHFPQHRLDYRGEYISLRRTSQGNAARPQGISKGVEKASAPLIRVRALYLACALALAAFAAPVPACAPGGESEELLVFAASSMAGAAEEIGRLFERETGVKVAFNFGASQSLARQAADGAPADVILTAGRFPMAFLAARAELAAGPRDILSNRLVVVTAAGAPPIDSLDALLAPRFRAVAIADPELAPAGRYARQALESAGLWDAVRPKLALAGNVRAALAYVETGSADAAVVYRTDAVIAGGVAVALVVPEDRHDPIAYPAAALTAAPLPNEARAFLDFLSGEQARNVFRKHGFIILE